MPLLSYISQENALKIAEAISKFTLHGSRDYEFSESDDAKLDELITKYAGSGASLRDVFDTAAAAVSALPTVDVKYQNFLENGEKIFNYINSPIYSKDYSRSPIQDKLVVTKIGQRMNRDQIFAAIDFILISKANKIVKDNKTYLRDIFKAAKEALGTLPHDDLKYQNFLNNGQKLYKYIYSTKIDQEMNIDKIFEAIDFGLTTSETNNNIRDAAIDFLISISEINNYVRNAAMLYSMYPGMSQANISNCGFQNASTILERLKDGTETLEDRKLNLRSMYPILEEDQHSIQDLFNKMQEIIENLRSDKSLLSKEIELLNFELGGQPIPDNYTKNYGMLFNNLLSGKTDQSSTLHSYLRDDSFRGEFSSFLNGINEGNFKTYQKGLKDFYKYLSDYYANNGLENNLLEGLILSSDFLLNKGFTPLMQLMVQFGMGVDDQVIKKYGKSFDGQASQNFESDVPTAATSASYIVAQKFLQRMAYSRITRAEEIANQANWVVDATTSVIKGLSFLVSAVTNTFRLAFGGIKGLFKSNQISDKDDLSQEVTPKQQSPQTAQTAQTAQPAKRAPKSTSAKAAVGNTSTIHTDRVTDRRSAQPSVTGRGQ